MFIAHVVDVRLKRFTVCACRAFPRTITRLNLRESERRVASFHDEEVGVKKGRDRLNSSNVSYLR